MSRNFLLFVTAALVSVISGVQPAKAGVHPASGFTSQTLMAGQLPAPSGLRVTRVEPRVVVLNWQAVPGAEAYQIRQFRELGGVFAEITAINVTGTWRVENLLLPDTDYRFEVIALRSGAPAGVPASIDVTTAQLPVFKVEIGLTRVTDSSVSITWFQRPQVEAYDIYRDGELLERETIALSGYTDETVDSDTTYRYQVAEVIGGRSGPLSDELIVRTLRTGAFGNPPPVEVTFGDRRRVVFRIGPVSPQPQGQTQIRVTGGNLGTLTLEVPLQGEYPYLWITDRDLVPGTTYKYDVGYIETDGTVGPIATVEATTDAIDLDVQGLVVTFTDRSRVVLRMDNPSGSGADVAFVIERDGQIIETTTADSGSRTWFTDRDLTYGSTHVYRVAMQVSGQRGPFSNEVTVTLGS